MNFFLLEKQTALSRGMYRWLNDASNRYETHFTHRHIPRNQANISCVSVGIPEPHMAVEFKLIFGDIILSKEESND